MKDAWADKGRGESCRHRTLAAIKEYFESRGLFVLEDPKAGCLIMDLAFYPPEAVSYRNENGDTACPVIITACEDGQFVTITSAATWNLRGCPHRASVYETLLHMTPEPSIVRFEHDPVDDGIRPLATVPIGDGGFSGDLIMKAVDSVLDAILRWDPVIRRAMGAGEVSVPSFPDRREELSPYERRRIVSRLIDPLKEDAEARWQWLWQDTVAAFGVDWAGSVPEELEKAGFTGTAAIVHGGRVLGLTRTLHEWFESALARAIAKKLER